MGVYSPSDADDSYNMVVCDALGVMLDVKSISARRVGSTWSGRTVRLVWRAWVVVLVALLASLASLVGLWIAGWQSAPSPASSVSGRVSALYPVEHYACFSTANGRRCGEVFSQLPLRVGENVRISQVTIAEPGGGTVTTLVVVKPLG